MAFLGTVRADCGGLNWYAPPCNLNAFHQIQCAGVNLINRTTSMDVKRTI